MSISPSVVSGRLNFVARSVTIDFGKLFSSSFDFLSFHTARVKVRSPGVQPASRLYPQLRTRPCTAQTDALCQKRHILYLDTNRQTCLSITVGELSRQVRTLLAFNPKPSAPSSTPAGNVPLRPTERASLMRQHPLSHRCWKPLKFRPVSMYST